MCLKEKDCIGDENKLEIKKFSKVFLKNKTFF